MKKIKITTFIAFIAILLSNVSSAQTNNDKYEIIKNKLKTIVPQGWTLDSKSNEFILSKDKHVRFFNFMSMVSLDPDGDIKYRVEHGITKQYVIKLVVLPLMDSKTYAEIYKINNTIKVSKETPIVESEFYINNYGKHQNYEPDYQELPNYYTDSFSIYCYTTQHPYFGIWPEEVAEECDDVIKSIGKLFNKYE